jgi:hypothetical protein
VPDNPRLDDAYVVGDPDPVTGIPSMRGPVSAGSDDQDAFSRTAPGQPQLCCQWIPCPSGCCLSYDGREKFYEPTAWMRYLIDHFLMSGAAASRSGLECFEQFTFDHELDGVIAACRRDTRRLWVIDVANNVVTERDLVAGAHESLAWGPFPYERELDDFATRRRRRRAGSVGRVVRPAR